MPDNLGSAASGRGAGGPQAIRPAGRAAVPPRAVPPEGGAAAPRPYINPQRNARLASTLPDGLWQARWRVELDPFFPYAFVLQAAGRIMLQGRERWQLFDLDGKQVAIDNYGDSEIVLDDQRALAYLADPFGRIAALRLDDAEQAFLIPVDGTGDYRRTFLARHGNRLVLTSFKRVTNPHDPVPVKISVAETYDLGDPPYLSEGMLLSTVLKDSLWYEVEGILAAMQGEMLVLAMQDRVVVADLNLHVQGDFGASFTPLAMSLDETGRIYLIVYTRDETERERRALWVLTPEGERLVDVEISEPATDTYAPPVVGYDHRVYLLLGDRILAISPEGEVLWNQHAGGTIAGAVVTADDRLLVSAGNALVALDAEGERQVLFHLEDDRWTTPPVLTAHGWLLAAAQRHLYCLRLNK